MNARVHIVPQSSFTATVNYCGVEMECTYEYEEAEAACFDVERNPCPGSPANAVLCECRIGGVDVIDMLTVEQIERVEEKILESMQ